MNPAHPLAFHVASTLTAFVTKGSYITALRRRLATLERSEAVTLQDSSAHTRNAARLWGRLVSTEAQWIRETIKLAEQPTNELGFATHDPYQGMRAPSQHRLTPS